MESNTVLDDHLLKGDNNQIEIQLITVNRFALLNILSFGLYTLWWMFKSWSFFKQKDNLKIVPAARAFFAIFFTISLFDTIQRYAQKNKITADFSSISLFILFIVLNLTGNLPDPFWIVSVFSFVAVIPPFKALNETIKISPLFRPNLRNEFSSGQIFILFLGIPFWGLIIYGTFFLNI